MNDEDSSLPMGFALWSAAMVMRREFMAFLAAATAACGGRPRADTATPETVGPAGPPGATIRPAPTTASLSLSEQASLAEAERWLGVKYTESERALLLDGLTTRLKALAVRREHAPDWKLSPATTFDPRHFSAARGPERDALRFDVDPRRPLPTSDEDIAFASALQLGAWIAAKKITSERLTQLYLERLRRFGPKLECVVTLLENRAMEQAKQRDAELRRGKVRSVLHGVPWGAKDLLALRGAPTTWGATPYQEQVLDFDAEVITRLDEAGAVLVAKLTLGALAYGDQWFGGRTRNPWNVLEGSSGSSAGSASAVVAGLVGFALGTETLGSIISPSMRCGATGLRPTFGRVPRSGAMPLAWSTDKIGPITRTAADAAAVLAHVHGAHADDPDAVTVPLAFTPQRDLRKLKIGYVPANFADAHPAERHVLDVLRELGATLIEVEEPDFDEGQILDIIFVEAAASFEEMTVSNRDDELVWQGEGAWPNTFRAARFVSAIDYVQAQRRRVELCRKYDALFTQVDAILSPSFAGAWLTATNFTGHPSLTLPVALVERSLFPDIGATEPPAPSEPFLAPLGMTLWGQLYQDGRLAEIGALLETRLKMQEKRPPLTS